ncbi:MAG: deacetylase, partial [Salinivenus sp.]
ADRFGSDQFKVVSLEAGRDDPEALWTELLSFLDLPPAPCPPPAAKPENPTGSPAFRRVYRAAVQPVKTHLPALYEWMLQSTAVRRAKLTLLSLLGTAEKDRVPAAVRARLNDEFAPTYAYLRDLGFDHYAPEAPEG